MVIELNPAVVVRCQPLGDEVKSVVKKKLII
jgi:hypothetical protein